MRNAVAGASVSRPPLLPASATSHRRVTSPPAADESRRGKDQDRRAERRDGRDCCIAPAESRWGIAREDDRHSARETCAGPIVRENASGACGFVGLETAASETEVRFRATTAAERLAYCRTGEPFDKAGGYGIQGHAAVFVEQIKGSYSGVVGLPLFETATLLTRCGIDFWLSARAA